MEEIAEYKVEHPNGGAPNELVEVVVRSGLEQTKGQQLLQMFTPFFNRMSEIETRINTLNKENPTNLDVQTARAIRLSLMKEVRKPAERVKDEGKRSILIETRLYDNLYGVINNTSKALEMQCEGIERFAEIQKEKKLQERLVYRLEIINDSEALRTLLDEPYDLKNMSEKGFDDLLLGATLRHEERLRQEAQRLTQEKAEAEEREKVRLENERLKKEVEMRDKAILEERRKAEAERRAIEEKARQEKLKAQSLADVERQKTEERERKIKAEADRKLKAEQEKRKAIEAEQKRKEAEELKAKKEEEKRMKKLANAPDREKIKNYCAAIMSVNLPSINNKDAKIVWERFFEKLNDLIQAALNNADEL